MDITDKVTVVSGGGSGIGRVTVLALVERGASVVVEDVDEAAGQRTGRGGVVINTASLIGLRPMVDAPVYAAAKAGVVNFSRSLAYLKEESGIRVNAICPELVDTPMAHSLGEERLEDLRAADEILPPEEIAAGVVELIEDNSHVGAVMRVTFAMDRATYRRENLNRDPE